jgi:hypothetical protein
LLVVKHFEVLGREQQVTKVQSGAYGGEDVPEKDWSIPENPRPQEETTCSRIGILVEFSGCWGL